MGLWSKITLDSSVQYLKGVGPRVASRLKKLEIKTIHDLLHYYPFRHEDFSSISKIKQIKTGDKVTLVGQIINIKNSYTRSTRVKTIQKAQLEDETGKISLIWFNQSYLEKTLSPPKIISVSGKVTSQKNWLQMNSPVFEILGEKTDLSIATNTGRLVPIYQITEGVYNKFLRKLIANTLLKEGDLIEDFLSDKILKEENLVGERWAIKQIHFPKNKESLEKAKKRLAFDELFALELKLLKEKQKWQERQSAPSLKINRKTLTDFISKLPFKLTKAQLRVIEEINKDIKKPVAMNRLLQGEVGSGKTIVAASAILQAANNGYQSVFMVPTEILAQQHYQNLAPLLKPFGVKTVIITSSTLKRKNFKLEIFDPKLIIGTHALIHKHAKFSRVGLVIIDEQHRFGVSQRAKLIEKAQLADKNNLNPHILTMTATPIPRTITLTIYGDLDISILDEMPRSKKMVKTFYVPKGKREACYQWIKKQLTTNNLPIKSKQQAFIICPLIQVSETLESVKAAIDEYQKLSKDVFPELRLGLLHGRMKSKEKETILSSMRNGNLDILIATPVVEVGIDLPNTSIMIIETADRFGLAQLHQLRGRIGRRGQEAYCLLFTEKNETKSLRRLKIMEKNNDGMKLAELDLRMRGPGELIGIAQHGFPKFKIANYSDIETINQARALAKKIVNQDSSLESFPSFQRLIETKFKSVQTTSN